MNNDIVINNLPDDTKQCFKLFLQLYPPITDENKAHICGQTFDLMSLMTTLKHTHNMRLEWVEAFLNKAGYKQIQLGSNENYWCWITGK